MSAQRNKTLQLKFGDEDGRRPFFRKTVFK